MLNSSRHRLQLELEEFARAVPSGALVLDAGSGDHHYRGLFEHARYESADLGTVAPSHEAPTYRCDLASLPVEDARYDFVVFTQVMEHLPEPGAVLRELRRVLKRGGRLFLSTPLFYEEHEAPFDFYRYTRFGVAHLLAASGFEVERLDWLEGYLGTVAYQLDTMARFLPSRPSDLSPGPIGYAAAVAVGAVRPLLRWASRAFHRLEIRSKYTERGFPKNYLALATRR